MTNPDLTGRRLGEYVLREAIGQGGGGLVYKSRQPTLDRDLVVKVLHNAKHQHSNAKERFLREAQLASRLRHPYAVPIFAFGVEPDGTRWIAMELAQGTTFDRWLRQHGPMSFEAFVPFFERVAEVVHAAHKLGIVHRDIKPSNVMVVADDADILVPKLLDFGIAKAAYDPPPPSLADGSLGENVPARPVSPATGKEVPPDHDEDEYEYEDFDYEAHERERAAVTRAALEQERAEAEAGGKPLAVGPFGAAPFGLVPFAPAPRAIVPPAPVPPMQPERVTRTDPEAYKVGYTPPGAPMGSAPYMSPEQFGDASSVGPAADIYSLGVFAHLALFGELPPPQAPKRPTNPTALERIFARALAWLPADRPPTALALAAEFRTALEASEREQLRASTRQWKAGDRAPGLLWGLDMLARYEQWTRTTTWRPLDEDEVAFIKQSHRRGRRSRWNRRLMIGLAATVVLVTLGGLQLYTSTKARLAREQVTQLEVEQGRQALHDNSAEAKVHLANAYRRGDHSNGTTFMLARALQSDRAQLARFPGRGGHMWSARFSPDGNTIVTTDDHAAQLWDARTYKLRFVMPQPDAVHDAMFSRDGKTLYTACNDGIIRAWDASTGVALRNLTTAGKPLHLFRLALSADEHMLAAIDIKGENTAVWDLPSSTVLATIANEGAWFPAIEFTADGKWLVTTGGNEVLIFDTSTRKTVRSIPKAMRLSVDPTAPHVATGSEEGDVVIWSIPDGAELRRLHASGYPIDQIAFSSDGKQLAAIEDGQSQLWDASTGQLRARIPTRSSKATSLEFSASSHLLISTFIDGAAVLVDSVTGGIRSVFEPGDGSLRVAHFTPNGEHVITVARSGTAKLWGAGGSYLRWSDAGVSLPCYYDLPSDQRFLSLACPGTPTRIWDVQEGRAVAELPSIVDLHADWISVLSAVSASGKRAAIARGRDVDIYELPGARVLQTVHHSADVNVVAFAPDAEDLVTGDLGGTVLLTRDGQDSVALPRATAGIDAMAFLRDRILVVSADLQLSIYDRTSLGLIAQRTMLVRTGTLRFSSDGTRMATIPHHFNGSVAPELWDLTRAQRIGVLQEPSGTLYSVWFPGDTHELLTTNADRMVRTWDADTGRLLQTYGGSATPLVDATVTTDGATVVDLGLDGVLRFWSRETARQLWSMPTLRYRMILLRRYRGDLITIGTKGEISGWRLPDADTVIKEVLDVAVSCGNETQPSALETCRSP